MCTAVAKIAARLRLLAHFDEMCRQSQALRSFCARHSRKWRDVSGSLHAHDMPMLKIADSLRLRAVFVFVFFVFFVVFVLYFCCFCIFCIAFVIFVFLYFFIFVFLLYFLYFCIFCLWLLGPGIILLLSISLRINGGVFLFGTHLCLEVSATIRCHEYDMEVHESTNVCDGHVFGMPGISQAPVVS